MVEIPESVRDAVSRAPLAHLTTVNRDGTPQVSVVWVGIQDKEFIMAHLHESVKIRNIRLNPTVVLSFLTGARNASGLDEHVIAYGSATITDGGAPELLQELARSYLGPTVEFPSPELRESPGFITHFSPARFGGVGPWAR